ncbi:MULTISPECIES: TetR/AcrR family transcriptional regulator [Streptomycetaceae]|uniref:TetR family transcriptional regulator n=1 Tax=Streptantibioticus cattleyicolor (strain ATCC 35852 / DSM 46488 / JCM 4925 / NBRC 14057 / NRRL 8057) TaxID=1003195 RepID=F8JS66_STREN|nr:MULTISPECIES: TetR/AcrR family transcriptional regulator [Streptomycetaceae]AEW94176.1 TetR family transcriptional regulator [Streptantibioticus cattleyicolor NRRL 8057 = DSM 46488]MYS58836.1 TetR family transcriptional regulator [Streptomyces sp. SID5468]CCB74530.1 putative tetR family transcriptional regulator [Streptantibioticus cattleyicolor NRRL 8057 = DSM 46488]
MPDPSGRPIRADARANEDRLLAAAAHAFARDGAAATLKQIAKDAGVGIATLYRRFPTREQLVDATYRYETSRLAARAPDLLRELPADRALRAWMSQVLDHLATKHGMADTLKTLLRDDQRLSSRTRDQLTGAIEEFRLAGIAQGVIRDDVPAPDILMSLAGVTLVAGAPHQRDQAERLLDLLMDALTRPDRRPAV